MKKKEEEESDLPNSFVFLVFIAKKNKDDTVRGQKYWKIERCFRRNTIHTQTHNSDTKKNERKSERTKTKLRRRRRKKRLIRIFAYFSLYSLINGPGLLEEFELPIKCVRSGLIGNVSLRK